MSQNNIPVHQRIHTILWAWTQHRPHKRYGGLSRDDLASLMAAITQAGAEAAEHDAKARQARARVKAADKLARLHVQRVVNSVKGDPEDGEDSDLYADMGYMRHCVRNKPGRWVRKNTGMAATEPKLPEASGEVDATDEPA